MSEYAEAIQRIVDALELEAHAHWLIGAALQEIPETRGASKAVASEVGRSASWVSEHRLTFAAFPNPEDRAPDMAWGIHVMCARTDDPARWLDAAVAEQFSTRQLRERMVEAGAIQASEREKPEPVCPHIVTTDEGTSYCRLAEQRSRA